MITERLSIGESNAIMQYLCESYPNELDSYLGLTIQQKAIVSQYLSWYQGSFRPALIRLFRINIQAVMGTGKLERGQVAEAEQKMVQTFDYLESVLSQGEPFICGENMTIADLLIFHDATNVEAYKFELTRWTNVSAWYNRMLLN